MTSAVMVNTPSPLADSIAVGGSTMHQPPEQDQEEDGDTFRNNFTDMDTNRPLFDLSLLNQQSNNNNHHNNNGRRHRATSSVATTADIASTVGSVMMAPREAFLKSFTFRASQNYATDDNYDHREDDDEMHWGITFGCANSSSSSNNDTTTRRFKLPGLGQPKARIYVEMIDEYGLFALSRIRPGDYLKSINGKTVGPSFVTGDRALAKMKECLATDGYLQVTTKNREEGTADVLVHATILKPHPKMSLKELGMTVWTWGCLCIKSIEKKSIFKTTALRDTDHIVSVNEIVCEKISPEQFAEIVKLLPNEVTITVLRPKQRVNGDFK